MRPLLLILLLLMLATCAWLWLGDRTDTSHVQSAPELPSEARHDTDGSAESQPPSSTVDGSREPARIPAPPESKAVAAKPPRKARGTENRILLQEAEYYLASADHNPNRKQPTAEQLAALRAYVSTEASALRAAEGSFLQLLDRCMQQKHEGGRFSDGPSKPIDDYAGTYSTVISGKSPDGAAYSHVISIQPGEFAELDEMRAQRLAALTAREQAIASMIGGW